MNYRNLFPWLVFLIGIIFLKLVVYLPLLNALVSVCFAMGVSDVIVWVVAPDCYKYLNRFIKGEIIEYTNQAAIGGLIWFILFTSILVTRYCI